METSISVVIPTFNEEEVISTFHSRLIKVLTTLTNNFEIIYVNDGSMDNTHNILLQLKDGDHRVGVINLSRNFGKEVALTAGLDHSKGDVIIPIDADLQDPPELIPVLLEKFQQGFDVVYATRRSRRGESWLKKFTAKSFYRALRLMSDRVQIPENTGDFRLMNRRALDELLKMREHHRFMKGLFTYIGFKQTSVLYDRDPRYAGRTKWDYLNLWNLSLEGITSFTIAPLKVATYVGLLISFFAFCYAGVTIFTTLVYGNKVPGYSSLMTVILFLGGIQLFTLGVMGEYLGRVFNEAKKRPLYIVEKFLPPSS